MHLFWNSRPKILAFGKISRQPKVIIFPSQFFFLNSLVVYRRGGAEKKGVFWVKNLMSEKKSLSG